MYKDNGMFHFVFKPYYIKFYISTEYSMMGESTYQKI